MDRSTIRLVSAAFAGVVFGFGLAIARMTDPQKIKDFLDLAAIPAGGWDPSLIFVMGGGVAVGLIGLRLNRVFTKPLAAPRFVFTTHVKIDAQLVFGAALFGVGWGISGFCPGPAIADLGLVPDQVILFVLAMFLGSWAAGGILQRFETGPHTAEEAAPG